MHERLKGILQENNLGYKLKLFGGSWQGSVGTPELTEFQHCGFTTII